MKKSEIRRPTDRQTDGRTDGQTDRHRKTDNMFTYPPNYPPTYLPTYLHTHIHTYVHTQYRRNESSSVAPLVQDVGQTHSPRTIQNSSINDQMEWKSGKLRTDIRV